MDSPPDIAPVSHPSEARRTNDEVKLPESGYVREPEPTPHGKPPGIGDEYLFKFMKRGKLGMKCKKNTSMVTAIKEDGCISEMNKSLPEAFRLQIGDEVLAINGIRKDPIALLRLSLSLEDGSPVEMLVKRTP